jgi:AcrR family transcriptional regulator
MKRNKHEELPTREKILDAAVKLLYGAQPREITTRKIAGEAGVNIAAINYHFRSKDELIDEAVRAATAAAFEMGMKMLRAPGKPAEERLRSFLAGYATGLVKFPGLTRNAWLGFFQKEGGQTFYGRFMKEMLESVGEVIAEIQRTAGGQEGGGSGAQDGNRAGAYQTGVEALMVISCVIFPFLASRTIRDAGCVDYEDDDARGRYIDTALAMLAGCQTASANNKGNQNG